MAFTWEMHFQWEKKKKKHKEKLWPFCISQISLWDIQVSWGAATWPAGHHLTPGTCRGAAVGLGYASWITFGFLAFFALNTQKRVKGALRCCDETEQDHNESSGVSPPLDQPLQRHLRESIARIPLKSSLCVVCEALSPFPTPTTSIPHLWSLSSPLFWRLVGEQCVHFPYCLMKMFLALSIRSTAHLMEKNSFSYHWWVRWVSWQWGWYSHVDNQTSRWLLTMHFWGNHCCLNSNHSNTSFKSIKAFTQQTYLFF